MSGHTNSPNLPAKWSKNFALATTDIWDALFLYWLLVDCSEQEQTLRLPHKEEQSQRLALTEAVQARNERMVGVGQEEWNHACDRCCFIESNVHGESEFSKSVNPWTY